MANYVYTSDILNGCLFRAGEPTDGSSDYAAEALTQINNVYNQICRGGSELDPDINEDWVWLRKPTSGTLVLVPAITTGTVTATQGSASITFSSGPVADSDNWSIKIATSPDVYHITTHTAGGTAATLDSTFTGVGGSGLAYTLFKTDYNLASDVLRLTGPMRTYTTTGIMSRSDYKIYGTTIENMEEDYPYSLIESGVPEYFAWIGETTSGVKRVRFNKYGGTTATTFYRVEYDYLFRPADLTNSVNEEPVIPKQWRHLLADFALAFILTMKSDDKAASTGQLAKAGLRGMMLENRHAQVTNTRDMFKIFPRQRSSKRKILRTESGLILG